MITVPGFEGRRVAVFGLGRSGLTAARALRAGGAEPVLWDDSLSSRLQAEAEGFAVEDLSRADWSDFAALILSPGAPLTHPSPHWTVQMAKDAGVRVMGDIELFARAVSALAEVERPKVIAITGTNGKSTTTALIGWVLRQTGRTVHVGGNIGIGVLALPEPTPDAIYVIEVSSYQLDLTSRFGPDVAVLTNISPDHLDRHGGMAGYVAAKRRIFQEQPPDGVAVIGVDDPYSQGVARGLTAFIPIRISAHPRESGDPVLSSETPAFQDQRAAPEADPLQHPKNWVPAFAGMSGVGVVDGWLMDGDERIADLSRAVSLPGRHNAQNAACAYAAVRAVGLTREEAVHGLLTFPGLAHRMEPVARLGRVVFINDSKATNTDAAKQALASYPRVWWIAGGRAKDGGIADLFPLFPRIAHAYLIGEAADAFAAEIDDAAPVSLCGDISSAVAAAARDAADWAEANDEDAVVLLSPAAASFDQYPDFEARGEAFRAAVLGLGAAPPVIQDAAS